MNVTWARDLRDVVLAVGLWLSTVLWFAYGRFYGELGIAPGDVGIGFGQVVERSIGAIPLMLVAELLLLACAAGAYFLVAGRGNTPFGDRYARLGGAAHPGLGSGIGRHARTCGPAVIVGGDGERA